MTIRVEDLEAASERYEKARWAYWPPSEMDERSASMAAARQDMRSLLDSASVNGVGISVPSSSGSGRYLVRFVGRPGDDEMVSLWDCSCPARSASCKHIKRVGGAVGAIGDALGYE
jgi:hypothetical protein